MGLDLMLRKYRPTRSITSCDSLDAIYFALKNSVSAAEGSELYLGFKIMLSSSLQHGGSVMDVLIVGIGA